MVRALSAVASLLVGCVPAIELDVDVEGETVVEQGTLVEDLLGSFPAFESLVSFDISDEQEFRNNRVEKEHVREARVTSITLAVLDPAGDTFDFLDAISFFVASPAHEEVEVASRQVPRGVESFELDVADVDVAPHVRDESLSVTTEASGRRPPRDTTVHARLVMHIVAQP